MTLCTCCDLIQTGKSKHFAFIEFRNAEVAKIVAETMDNYLLFGHLLKCHVVDPSKVHPDTFKGANRKFTKLPWEKMERERQNRTRTPEQEEQRVKRLLEKEADRRTKLAEVLGEEYEFSGYAGEIAESAGGKAKVETKKALAPEKAPTEKPKKKKLKA